MPQTERYFDNAATSSVDPRVTEEMLPFFGDAFGNANSIHGFGQRASAAVDQARERVASLLGADDPSEVVFTSGATEANNWVVQRMGSVVCSPFEHSSVFQPVRAMGGDTLLTEGYRLQAPDRGYDLAAVMLANNETGAILDCPEGCAQYVLRDVTQALGKIPIPSDLDFGSCSAHKIYGPKGIGALYLRGALDLEPLLYGGEQENGLRSGTLNVPGIVGFGAACAIAEDEMVQDFVRAEKLRGIVLEGLKPLSDWRTNDGSNQSPFILSLSFAGVEGESLVIDLDAKGFAISAGAACSSRSTEPSHVLLALGLEESYRRGTVRISFGRFNTPECAVDLTANLLLSVQKLRTMR